MRRNQLIISFNKRCENANLGSAGSVEKLGLKNVICVAWEILITAAPGRQVCQEGGDVGCTAHLSEIRLCTRTNKSRIKDF